MKFVLASVGSAGDAHPYIAIGNALRARGHEVAFFTNHAHQPATQAAGLAYLPADDGNGGELAYAAALANPNLWHPVKGMGVLWHHLLAPSIAPLYRTLANLQAADPSLRVLAGPQMMGARLAQVHLGVHLTSLVTSPNMLRSCQAPISIAHVQFPRGTPQWLLRAAWNAVDRYKLDPMARKTLVQVCQQLGIAAPPATASLFGDWMHSAKRVVTLYPEWFAPPKLDHPAQLVYGDFVTYNLDAQASMPIALSTFLQSGSPPVVVMFGTAMAHASAQFAVWQDALVQLNMRGVFLSAHPAQFPAARSQSIFYTDYAPFSQLLPLSAALVHHGGIGSCAQALAAGIAQIIQPCAHDQFENARCVSAQGAGQSLHRRASLRQVQTALMRWARNRSTLAPTPQQACDKSRSESLDELCELLEQDV